MIMSGGSLSKGEISSMLQALDCRFTNEYKDKPSSSGLKYDNGKLRLDLLPPEAIRALGNILSHGAEKYGPNTWRGVSIERYEAAMLRHWLAWKEGETIDPESGLPHLAHMLTNAAFMVGLDKK